MKKSLNGAKNAISRYVKLKEMLDSDLYNNNWVDVDTQSTKIKKRFNFVDLFSGAGGLSLGFVQGGFNKLASNEINPIASETIKMNFPNSKHINAPIEEVTDKELLNLVEDNVVHVVCGGPPCQGFSVAGLRDPNDKRNKLFLQFVRVVSVLKPWYVLLENVPGILTMSDGKVKDAIIKEFGKIGYPDMSVRILEAADYGVPQLRTRAIFIANRFGLKNPYPKSIYLRENYKPIESAIFDLIEEPRNPDTNHEWTKHSAEFEKRIKAVKPGGSLYETFADAFKRQYLGVPSMTIKENHGGTHIHPTLNRCISAREMARLQTFPDDFIFAGPMKKAMWQIGNAVPVLLGKHMAIALKTGLAEADKSLA